MGNDVKLIPTFSQNAKRKPVSSVTASRTLIRTPIPGPIHPPSPRWSTPPSDHLGGGAEQGWGMVRIGAWNI
ncbi:hypothetical protein JCM18882A_21400 [Brevibacterium metallidurans]|uniref:Uncharacterized protein n=1 Tax=Brevibacterium metallidurans TaxID=1482676 RepID=A0ABN0SPH6_9MICO